MRRKSSAAEKIERPGSESDEATIHQTLRLTLTRLQAGDPDALIDLARIIDEARHYDHFVGAMIYLIYNLLPPDAKAKMFPRAHSHRMVAERLSQAPSKVTADHPRREN
jgi:hypothetical protein